VDGSYVMKINYNLDNYYLFRPLSGISYLGNFIEIIFVRMTFEGNNFRGFALFTPNPPPAF